MSVWDPMSERPYHGWLHDGARVPVPVHSGRKPRLAGPLIALAFKGVTQMIIFLLVLIFLAILWPGLIRWTLAMLLVINRTPCSIISDKDEKRVRKVCAIGSKCEIWGIIRLCKHDSDCVEI